VRWLIALLVSVAMVSPAAAGVFKPRSPAKPGAKKPAEKPADKAVAAAPAKAAPAPVAAKAPAKTPAKKPSSVATKGRPSDLTPKPKKKKDGDVVIIEDKGDEDVIVKDDD
jgi:hypothetical protein